MPHDIILNETTLRHFPMGPKLRACLGIQDDYKGDTEPLSRTSELDAAFTVHLRRYHTQDKDPLSGTAVADLIDELVTMDLPEATLEFADARPDAIAASDFRTQLALGVASMLVRDLKRAEEHLRHAQAAIPEEPAPYVNLVQIFLELGREDEAEIWCLAGLDAEPNHIPLWDLLAQIYQGRYGEYLGEELQKVAERRASWAGLSLAAELTSTGDRYHKANLLERLYFQGERDPRFLIELTGAYGIAGQFERIPTLVWQAEKATSKGLPWQLHLHAAQAQLALGRADECLAQLAKARKDPSLPHEAQDVLKELEAEARG